MSHGACNRELDESAQPLLEEQPQQRQQEQEQQQEQEHAQEPQQQQQQELQEQQQQQPPEQQDEDSDTTQQNLLQSALRPTVSSLRQQQQGQPQEQEHNQRTRQQHQRKDMPPPRGILDRMERTMTNAKQKAERVLKSVQGAAGAPAQGAAPGASGVLVRGGRPVNYSTHSVGREPHFLHTASEEEQLQWAMRASLQETHTSFKQDAVEPGSELPASCLSSDAASRFLQSQLEESRQRCAELELALCAAEDRAHALEATLHVAQRSAETAAAEAASARSWMAAGCKESGMEHERLVGQLLTRIAELETTQSQPPGNIVVQANPAGSDVLVGRASASCLSIHEWLESIRTGYGQQFATAFEKTGYMDTSDLVTVGSAELDTLLVHIRLVGGKPPQVHQIREALVELVVGHRHSGMRASTAATKKEPELALCASPAVESVACRDFQPEVMTGLTNTAKEVTAGKGDEGVDLKQGKESHVAASTAESLILDCALRRTTDCVEGEAVATASDDSSMAAVLAVDAEGPISVNSSAEEEVSCTASSKAPLRPHPFSPPLREVLSSEDAPSTAEVATALTGYMPPHREDNVNSAKDGAVAAEVTACPAKVSDSMPIEPVLPRTALSQESAISQQMERAEGQAE